MPGALEGIRVIEFAHHVQGPQCGAMLHDLGAEVIKIESPGGGDHARRLTVDTDDPRAPYYHAQNRGKRSVALDVGRPAGLAVARRLIEGADVLLCTLRPGALDRLGLGYEACAELNPRLVYASGSTYGPRGALADRPGVDLIAQAYGGLAWHTGSPERPTQAGATVADSAGAQMLCVGILAALLARERTGRGQRVDSSLYGAQIWAQSSELSYQLIGGREYERIEGGQPNLSRRGLYGVYPTSDGAIALTGVQDPQWRAFREALGDAELEDPRFATMESRAEHVTALRATVGRALAGRSTEEWLQRLEGTEVRYTPVNSYAAIERDEQARVNGYLVETEHPEWGRMVNIGSPLELSDTPTQPSVRAPSLGEHTVEVLREAGYDDAAIEELRAAGAI